MAMSSERIFAIGLIAAALTACSMNRQIGTEDPGIGETVKYDAALQTINPVPVYAAGAAQPGSSGDVGAAAVKRYRTDKVKSLEPIQTTSGSNSGSGTSSTAGYTPH
jgi:hypothetical protein